MPTIAASTGTNHGSSASAASREPTRYTRSPCPARTVSTATSARRVGLAVVVERLDDEQLLALEPFVLPLGDDGADDASQIHADADLVDRAPSSFVRSGQSSRRWRRSAPARSMPSASPSAVSTRAAAIMSPRREQARAVAGLLHRAPPAMRRELGVRRDRGTARRAACATLYGSARFHIAASSAVARPCARAWRGWKARRMAANSRVNSGGGSAAARTYSGRAISSARPTRKRTSASERPSVSAAPTTTAVGGCATSATCVSSGSALRYIAGLAVAEQRARNRRIGARQIGLGHRRDAIVRPDADRSRAPARARPRCPPTAPRTRRPAPAPPGARAACDRPRRASRHGLVVVARSARSCDEQRAAPRR